MELPVQSSSQSSQRRNYERAPWCYLLWGVPGAMIVVTDGLWRASILSSIATGVIWVVSVAWIGVGCFINARSCGRVHCRIDGIALPVLSLIGVLNLLSIVSFDWNLFLLSFIIILVASFVPELTWKRYS